LINSKDIDNKLLDVYENIISNNTNKTIIKPSTKDSFNGIKIGDLIVFNINNLELKGHVNDIVNNKYLINGNFTNENKQLLIDFDQIIEHYPKNVNFQQTDKLINDSKPIQKIESKNVTIFFPVNTTKETIDETLSNSKNFKYFIREKDNELHIVKINKGFEIKPFVESTIHYMLKNKMIKENISSMKIIGNNSFCIMKNIPPKTYSTVKNILMKILK